MEERKSARNRLYETKNNVNGVDTVTFPGADGIFSSKEHSKVIELIRRAVSISIGKYGSRVIAVVGHDDCVQVIR
jgi:hypothetical protein